MYTYRVRLLQKGFTVSNKCIQLFDQTVTTLTHVLRAMLQENLAKTVPECQTVLVGWCLMTFSAQIGYVMPQEYEIYYVGSGGKTNTPIKQYNKLKKS